MMCWYCHWGWPKAVALIYKEALRRLEGDNSPLDYGPAHVVWADENFDCAESCLGDFDKYADRLSEDEQEVVRWSLEQLAKIPLSERDPAQDDWHNNATAHPPPDGVELISTPEIEGWAAEFMPKTVWDRLGELKQ